MREPKSPKTFIPFFRRTQQQQACNKDRIVPSTNLKQRQIGEEEDGLIAGTKIKIKDILLV